MSIIVLSDYRNTTQGYAKAINEIDELEQKLSQQEVHAKIGEISRQVAHDIRSPLSALNMLSSSLKEISEEKRLILRTATQRINDIANELLQKSKFDLNLNITEANTKTPILSDSLSPKNLEPIMISALLDTIVSEKRVQYSRRGEIDIHADLTQGYGLFAKIEPSALARVVSNLINNSVEAIPSSGYVRLALTGTKDQILISVKDNGEGIAPTLLSKLGHEGASFGKKGEQSGFGLGLVHARKVLEEAGGQLLIESNLGHGTTISLILPKASTPTWFVDFIALPRHAVVVSVDDDLTIHQIWSGRFSSLDQSSSKVKPMAFTSIDKFEDWLAHNKTLPTLFLIDYEFIGQGMNGIDVIQRNGIADRAVLVTSRYEEPAIKELAKALKIKLLPKGLAPVVPIIIEKSFPS
jgi:hypothetical protein